MFQEGELPFIFIYIYIQYIIIITCITVVLIPDDT